MKAGRGVRHPLPPSSHSEFKRPQCSLPAAIIVGLITGVLGTRRSRPANGRRGLKMPGEFVAQ